MKSSKVSGPTACRPCAKAKAKCIFLSKGILPDGKCTRCNRLNKDCSVQTPTGRSSRNTKSTQVAQTRGRLDGTFMFLKSPQQGRGTIQDSSLSNPIIPSLPTLKSSSSWKQNVVPSSLFSSPSAFLGPTSFSAVFHDHRDNFDHETSSEMPLSPSSGIPVQSLNRETYGPRINADLISLGTRVLMQIPNAGECSILFSRHVNPNDGWIRLAGQRLSDSIWPTIGGVLEECDALQVKSLVQRICHNTAPELREEDDPVKWIKSFSGANLRWEALGILFTYWSFGALSSPENDPVFSSSGNIRQRRDVMIELKECAASCIVFCSLTDRGNPLLVYLLYKHSLLETMVSSDTSLIYWRQHGDLCSMTTAFGMHRDVEQNPTKVTISSEMRRRTYAAVFNIDKVTATFTGRPPMLSHRYSTTPLPLDLSDEQLLSDRETLSGHLRRLDANGWNTDGQIYSTTILRARTSFSIIRSQVLDMALSSVINDIGAGISYLKQWSKSTYAQLPAVITCHPEDLSDPNISGWVLYSRLLTRLEHLQNLFLLERMLIKYGLANAQELMDISREMLSLTSGIWKERERLKGLHGDFEWLIMYHAVPASGLICVELLKEIKDPSYYLIIARSDCIQDLIMFINFLDWVKPAAPNYSLCKRIREIIGKVLEQVLEAPRATAEKSTAPELTLDFNFDLDLRGFDDYPTFDLLDTFDWCDEPWATQT